MPALPPDPAVVSAVREVLAESRSDPGNEEALAQLNLLLNESREHMLLPAVAGDVVTTAEALALPVLALGAPTPAQHAHLTILMSTLLQLQRERDRVDGLFAMWLRHPTAFGTGHATPPEFQRPEFVSRLIDVLGWKKLDVRADREALERFLTWVNSWTPASKQAARSAYEQLRRSFHAPDLWWRVKFAR